MGGLLIPSPICDYPKIGGLLIEIVEFSKKNESKRHREEKQESDIYET